MSVSFKDFSLTVCSDNYLEKSTKYDKMWSNVIQLPQLTIRTLFFALVSTAWLLFDELHERITDIITHQPDKNIQPITASSLSLEVDNLKFYHCTVVDLLDKVNDCFGFILLIDLFSCFTFSIVYFYYSIMIYGYIVFVSFRHNLGVLQFKCLNIEAKLVDFPHLFGPGGNQIRGVIMAVAHLYNKQCSMISMFPAVIIAFAHVWLRLFILLVPSYATQQKV